MSVPVSLLKRARGRALLAAVLAAAVLAAIPSIAYAESTFSITGRGWGHGIGLSQYGAKGMAEAGSGYRSILAHYYQGTTLGSSSNIVVKVNLDRSKNSRGSWWFRAGDNSSKLVVRSTESTDQVTLSGEKSYWVTVYEGGIRVRASSNGAPGTLIKKFPAGVTVVSTAPTNGEPPLVTILTASGPYARTGVRWRGTVNFSPAGTTTAYAINRVRMEDYLYGVVPRESPALWHAEALKAQAVAARSYAYTSAANGSVLYCTVYSQVYGGHSQVKSSGIVDHEDARTNSAVNATRGQVVKYGSTIVRTYFFSSSGGHTANIEDVWGGTPRVYYTGVPDSKENSPYTKSWGDPIVMNGTTMAAEVRKKYPTDETSGASATNVSLSRASSGHVKSARLYWSNGANTVLTGDQLRSALGLRSTVFYIKVNGPFPTPAGAVRYQQNNPGFLYSGTWRTASDSRLSSGTWTYSRTKGSRATLRFKGKSVYWISKKRSSYGMAAVYLDGKYQATVNLYSGSTRYQRLVWSKTGMSDAVHTLEIRVLGSKDSRASDYYVGVDAVDIAGQGPLSPPSAIRFEQDRLGLAYSGTWLDYESTTLSGGSYRYTKTAGDKATIRFRGKAAYWVTTKKNAYGIAEVLLDGQSKGRVNLYAETPVYQQVVWAIAGLADTEHVLEIRATGEKDPLSLNVNIGVDAIDVVGKGVALPAGATRYEQPDSHIAYTGTWTPVSGNSLLSGGSYRYATAAGATAELSFSGSEVYWITTRKASYGLAEVFLDGVSQGVVDLYTADTRYQQAVWSKRGLAPGPHKLKIRVLRLKNPASSSYLVGVDAFDVVAP